MSFEKRVAVLKQVGGGFSSDGGALSGVVYAERLGEKLTLLVKTTALAPVTEGRYVLVFSVGKEKLCMTLNGGNALTVENAPSVKDGFAVLIAYFRGEAQPVAFGCCGNATGDYRELLAALSEKGEKKKRSGEKGERKEPRPFREDVYGDEAVAESSCRARLSQNDGHDAVAGKKTAGKQTAPRAYDFKKNDGSFCPFLRTQGSLTYYGKVREELCNAFENFPPDTRLLHAFPCSDWVKIEETLFGILYENGLPRYLCVAVEKRGSPPPDMQEHCTFVPAMSPSEGQGFYVVFQDADTGAYTKLERG